MGARPSQFKKAGGFLNNVDGSIADYVFTDEFNGQPFVPGRDPKTKKEKFHSLYFLLSARADGADEDVSTSLFAGGANDFNISDDGKSIWDSAYETEEDAIATGADARTLGGNTALGKFLSSLCNPENSELKFPEDRLSEDRINYEPIIGTRVRFAQKPDEGMKGKKQKGKNGREYDYRNLVVDQVYELPEEEGGEPEPAKTTGKGSVKGKPQMPKGDAKPLGAKKGTKAVEPEFDLDGLTTDTLSDILKANKGSIIKSKLSMQIRKALIAHEKREDVVKRAFDDGYLSGADVPWSYDKAKGLLTAVEAE